MSRRFPPPHWLRAFELRLPSDEGFFLVSPTTRSDSRSAVAFRDWLLAESR